MEAKESVCVNGRDREVVTEGEARHRRFRPMTTAYQADGELWMMDNVAKDLDAWGNRMLLVQKKNPHDKECGEWYEIWKK